jgi:hypothetical protein
MSRATAGGRESLDVKIPGADAARSWIIEPADKKAWAAARAFHPGEDGGDKTGTTKLTVRTRPIPEGGSVRWSVPPSQAGRFTLQGGAGVQGGLTAEISGLQPGLTAIDFDVLDADGKSIESQKYPLSIPQYVMVDHDATFLNVMTSYGLIDFEMTQLLSVARDVCNAVLKDANVRTVWINLSEQLPAHLNVGQPGNAMVTNATFVASVAGGGLYGRCHPPFAPNIFNEKIEVYARGFEEAVSGNANEHVDEVTNEVVRLLVTSGPISSVEKDLGIQVLGRLYGETLAHEIGHSLIGTTLTSLPHHDHNASPGTTGDLMNRGIDRSFGARTGCSLNGGQVTPPLVDNLSLLPGIPTINVPLGQARTQIDNHFPVPPIFK